MVSLKKQGVMSFNHLDNLIYTLIAKNKGTSKIVKKTDTDSSDTDTDTDTDVDIDADTDVDTDTDTDNSKK